MAADERDVVSQRKVQEFLRYYQRKRRITVLLTSHYMKDVEALCRRAVIIDGGRVRHDGPLAEIIDRFSTTKVIEIQFGGAFPTDLTRYGTVLASNQPRARIEVPRQQIPEVLAALLARHTVEDVSVEDRPLEEVIAELFTTRDDEPEIEARDNATTVAKAL